MLYVYGKLVYILSTSQIILVQNKVMQLVDATCSIFLGNTSFPKEQKAVRA